MQHFRYHRDKALLHLCLFPALLLLATSSFAGKAPYVPEDLKPWVDWVLEGKEQQLFCTAHYDDHQQIRCNWPSKIELNIHNQGGEFTQFWQMEFEQWVALPGDRTKWPFDIKVDDIEAIVVERNGRPQLFLEKGLHKITGRFSWSDLPESIPIPSETGIVLLQVNKERIDFPNLDNSGQLWLKQGIVEEKVENRLKIDSYRLINDTIPARVVIYATLDIAGANREITVGPLYHTEKMIPLSLQSQLPCRLEQNGKLRMQVRPGRYSMTLSLRHVGPLQELSLIDLDTNLWPDEEIWAFQAQPDVRLVEVKNGVSIDPLQTSIPEKWRQLPTFKVKQGDKLLFKQIKRGDPQPAPDQLSLQRNLWLRFDGSGYTIEDTITGKKNTNWRLEINPEIQLGRVGIDGREQFITKKEGSDKAGIELRNGMVHLNAHSLYSGNVSSFPAIGWDHDFQRVQAYLHLPPGWQILSASGMDNISSTWLKKWTLLDFFIVLIFTIAIARTVSLPCSIIAFATLVLVYHEPHAPRYIWLALLIGLTLLKYLPESKFKNFVRGYQILTILGLIVITIPYSIDALRIGIYPQLAKPWVSMADYSGHQQRRNAEKAPAVYSQSKPAVDQTQDSLAGSSGSRARLIKSEVEQTVALTQYSPGKRVMQYDPKTFNQTGPGLPKWQPFERVSFGWSGPVDKGQTVSFTFLGPKVNMVLSFIRVGLIIALALAMLGIRISRKGKICCHQVKTLAPMITLLVIFCCSSSAGQAAASEFPSQKLLDQLEQRLLKKDSCYPDCAAFSFIDVAISPDALTINAHVQAQRQSAVPLPGHVKQWIPKSVLLDGKVADGLVRIGSNLWVIIPAGTHTLTLQGSLRKQNTIQLPFLLKPHRLQVSADGWSVEGVHDDGSFDSQLQFKRILSNQDNQAEVIETGILPSFLRVERTLLLGLVWKVQTRVHRVSPPGNAIVEEIPLIAGESVITKGIRVQDGMVKINLSQNQRELMWESFLEPKNNILLEHASTSAWTEIWQVDVSPVFHLDYQGIPVIHHKVGSRWYPTWHPWPGEQVKLTISRPAGVAGQTMTIEKSHLLLQPGQRSTAATLQFEVKSSQGGQHVIEFFENIKLQEVKVNGTIQPLRLENKRLSLPIVPGKQHFTLKWLENRGMAMHFKSSRINLGLPSVNSGIDVRLPSNRWPLFIGGEPFIGPAVLFWSVLIIVVVVALCLSLTGWTPLRFYHWLLLGIGLSMSNLLAGLLVAGWLVSLDYRSRARQLEGRNFNLLQLGIVIMTLLGLGSLVFAISNGLLGHPDMNIVGNGSSRNLLRWYHDVSKEVLPQAWVFSIPMLAYRIAMLLWALWVSFWLIGILKWGWQQFSTPQLWSSVNIEMFGRKRKQHKE